MNWHATTPERLMHTPKPWRATMYKRGKPSWSVREGFISIAGTYDMLPSGHFGWVFTSNKKDEVVKANAMLIAAAPDMLDALRILESILTGNVADSIVKVATDAIKRATSDEPFDEF